MPQKLGDRIETGSLVAKIMPLNQEMIAEIQLSPDEMNHIKIGQQVLVKINAFDTTYFGEVKGVIRKISAKLGQSGEGKSFYKVVIALSRNYVKRSNRNLMIRPGMAVSVQFVTGSQSFVNYVLKPVYKSANLAFARE
jgi:HlyD family secretion protein/adhesin transport system membrane fusion protein